LDIDRLSERIDFMGLRGIFFRSVASDWRSFKGANNYGISTLESLSARYLSNTKLLGKENEGCVFFDRFQSFGVSFTEATLLANADEILSQCSN